MPLKDGSWCLPPSNKISKIWKFSSRFTISCVGLFGKIWLEKMNKVKVYNRDNLVQALDKCRPQKGVLTVSNHTSCIDDPLMWGTLNLKQLVWSDSMRWTSAAEDICFTRKIFSLFFAFGQTFPIVRGDGVYQKGMDFMVDQLDVGQWCHIFPEGKVNMTKEFMRLKWGVGRVIADCRVTPVVLPIWHIGMDSILPNTKPYIPRIRKHVTLLIGRPLDFAQEVEWLKSSKKTPQEIRKFLTDQIQEEFKMMREKAEQLHREFLSSS